MVSLIETRPDSSMDDKDGVQIIPVYEEKEWPTKCISQITKMEVQTKSF